MKLIPNWKQVALAPLQAEKVENRERLETAEEGQRQVIWSQDIILYCKKIQEWSVWKRI